MALKIVILGANGFIGSALTNAILRERDWEVYGIDLADNKLGDLPDDDRFHFVEGDISRAQQAASLRNNRLMTARKAPQESHREQSMPLNTAQMPHRRLDARPARSTR